MSGLLDPASISFAELVLRPWFPVELYFVWLNTTHPGFRLCAYRQFSLRFRGIFSFGVNGISVFWDNTVMLHIRNGKTQKTKESCRTPIQDETMGPDCGLSFKQSREASTGRTDY